MKDLLRLADRYAGHVDARDWDAATALFAEDGVLVVPDPPEHLGPTIEHIGRERIRAAFAELEATDATQHVVTGVDDCGHVACIAHHVMGDRCVDWHLHYVDYVAGGLFVRRELHIDRIETHPA